VQPGTIDAAALHTRLKSGEEIALADVREQGVYGSAHILRAVNIPRSRFELRYRALIPRKRAPVVLCDGAGEGLAREAAAILTAAGWTDVSVLDGGVAGWEAVGLPLFSGVNVPSKAFGEYVEQRFGTPHIGASELAALQRAGRDLAILDSRPFGEFHAMSIPGGIDVPGAELVHRVRSAVPDPKTLIVVNCAGRTRSIIGAQSLINAGVPNPVVALENGTMGWMLAGLECAHQETAEAPTPDAEADRWAREAARKVGARFGVRETDWPTVQGWCAEESRTTYLLDVRGAEEFEAGHIPGSRHAPGGQLVQATDAYVAVQNARLVLIDDTGTRAAMTASWLRQMGWADVFVLRDDFARLATQTGPVEEAVPELALMPVGTASARDLLAQETRPTIIDFSRSLSHRKRHPAGARFAIRSRALDDLAPLLGERWLFFTAEDPRIATLAAQDMTRAGVHRIKVLEGGTAAWAAAGGPMEDGMTDPLSPEEDVFHKPYDLTLDKAAMQRYIDWEVALVPQVAREGTLTFPEFE
jgi:rhodanese-related sulfurtransferase